MINVFHKDSDKRFIRYRTAYIKEESTQVPFKYYKMSDSDISKKDFLKGIEMQECSFTIRTMFQYQFTLHTKILVEGKQYKIGYIYREEDESANGVFRKNVKPYTYLGLVG